jgi:DNA-binding response OmpR family regulator
MEKNGRRVLIVEDDFYYRHVVCAVVRLGGWLPVIAETMAAAIAIQQLDPIDTILLDLRLPDSDTVRTLSRIELLKTLAGGGRVFVLTGAPLSEEVVMLATVAGAATVLSKDDVRMPDYINEVLKSPTPIAAPGRR